MDIKCRWSGAMKTRERPATRYAKATSPHTRKSSTRPSPNPARTYKSMCPASLPCSYPMNLSATVIGPGGKESQGAFRRERSNGVDRRNRRRRSIEVAAATTATHRQGSGNDQRQLWNFLRRRQGIRRYRALHNGLRRLRVHAHRDGLLHISEIAWERLDDMEASGLKEGDKVEVKSSKSTKNRQIPPVDARPTSQARRLR